MDKFKKMVIVVPAFCEEKSVAETIRSLRLIKESLQHMGITQLIYVVNDGSNDKTAEQAALAGADKILHHRVNQGLGAAVRTGLQRARRDQADILVKFDADLQHDPKDILELIRPILQDEAEVVYGNRFQRMTYRMPFVRRVGNVVFMRLMRWLTKWPVYDSQPGIFAASKEYLDVAYIPGDYNYTQQILLDAYHKGMRFAQVPVTFNKRFTGSSFVSISYPARVLPQIIQVIVGIKPLKIFGPIAFFFLSICVVIACWNLSIWFSGNATRPIQNVNLVLGSGMFGLQTFFFGVLADLIVKQNSV